MQKPWLINDLVIDDWHGLTDRSNSEMHSLLVGGIGLPGASAVMSQRATRWPLAAGLRRPGDRLNLVTRYMLSDAGARYLRRKALYDRLNPEKEVPSRLVVADYVAPEGLILSFGPWEIERVWGAATWYCYSNQWTRSGGQALTPKVTALLNKAVHFEDGYLDRQRALVIEETTTNLLTNPSAEVDAANFTLILGSVIARSSEAQKFGFYSMKVTPGVADYSGIYQPYAGFAGGTTYTFSVYLLGEAGVSYQVDIWDGVLAGSINVVATGEWQRVVITHTLDGAAAVCWCRVMKRGVGTDVFYTDGWMLEQQNYATTYCDGTLGTWYYWNGTAHASTSARSGTSFELDSAIALISEQDTLSFRCSVIAPYDATAAWPGTDFAPLFDARGADVANQIRIIFDETGNDFLVWICGGTRLRSGVQAFLAGDRLDVVITLDFAADIYRLYINGVLRDVSTGHTLAAPLITDWALGDSYLADGTKAGGWWHCEYDVYDRVLTADEVKDLSDNGAAHYRARYKEVICESSEPLVLGQTPTNHGDVSLLAVHDDVRWRSMDGDYFPFWLCQGTAYTIPITVDTDDEVHPVFHIVPRVARDANTGYAYRMCVQPRWYEPVAAERYPICIQFDGAALITASKLQADGDDLRVFNHGVEIDRWFETGAAAGQLNSTTARVWVNLDFKAKIIVTLRTAIAGAGAITTIEVNEDISGFPNSGWLHIASEIFSYTSKSDVQKTFYGVTRTLRGTAAAAHNVGDSAFWCQHDLIMVYGNNTATAPIQDDDYKPAFDLSSSHNGYWYYDTVFGEDDGKRAAQWVFDMYEENSSYPHSEMLTPLYRYQWATAATGVGAPAWADPWTAISLRCRLHMGTTTEKADTGSLGARVKLYNPCGITQVTWAGTYNARNANYQDEVYVQTISSEDGTEWALEGNLANGAVALDANGLDKWVGIGCWANSPESTMAVLPCRAYAEAGAAGVTLYDVAARGIPAVYVRAEQANYHLNLKITHVGLNEEMWIEYPVGLLATNLMVDCANKEIIDFETGLKAHVAVVTEPRQEWFRLVDGINSLTFLDAGTNAIQVEVLWTRRYTE